LRLLQKVHAVLQCAGMMSMQHALTLTAAPFEVFVASKHLKCSCRVALQHLPAITVRSGLVCEGGRQGSVLSPAVVQQPCCAGLLLLSSCLMARLALIPA
jgi:hypothetical protein